MNQLKKGMKVRVKAEVRTGQSAFPGLEEIVYDPGRGGRKLIRHPITHTIVEGIVVGYTFRQTGWYHPASPEYGEFGSILGYDPPYFESDKYHKVWLVESLILGDRYTKPFVCLEEDLEIISE